MLLVETVAVKVTSALHVETTLDVLQLGDVGPTDVSIMFIMKLFNTNRGKDLLIESTREVNGASDGLESREGEAGELVVTSDLEATVDGLERGDAEVGQLGVGVEDQVTSLGEVGGAEGHEAVAPEAHLTGQVVERRHGNAADITESHVGTASEVGELDLERVHVTSEVDETSGVGQVVDVNGLQVGVLGDVKVTHGVEGDTVQAGETGVGDGDIASLGDTGGEVQLLQLGQGRPTDATDAAERAEAQGVEARETIELKGVADGAQGGGGQRGEVASTRAAEATGDLLNTIEGQGVGNLLADLDVTVNSLAAVVLIGIPLAGYLDSLAVTAIGIGQSDLAHGQERQKVLHKRHCGRMLTLTNQWSVERFFFFFFFFRIRIDVLGKRPVRPGDNGRDEGAGATANKLDRNQIRVRRTNKQNKLEI